MLRSNLFDRKILLLACPSHESDFPPALFYLEEVETLDDVDTELEVETLQESRSIFNY